MTAIIQQNVSDFKRAFLGNSRFHRVFADSDLCRKIGTLSTRKSQMAGTI